MTPWKRPERPARCREVGRVLQRYLDGEVDDLTARRVARHLEDCLRCGMAAETYAEIKRSLARRGEVDHETVGRLKAFGEHLVTEGDPADDEGQQGQAPPSA